MTARRPCPPAPGPLEKYAARFDDLFFSLAQRRGFREYLTGLLAPRERNKTITCLAGAEPVAGAGLPGVQRLQFFLSESPWEAEQVNDRRLELLREESATAPYDGGVIVIDDSGDRKDGTATAHVGRQWLGRLGKTDNGTVTVTTVWTDGRVYYPLDATPYTPAHHFARGRSDPAFRTKPQPAAHLAARGKEAGFGCRAVVADCAYLSQRRLVPRAPRGRPGLRGRPQAAQRYLGPGRPVAHPHRGRPRPGLEGRQASRRLDTRGASLPRRAHRHLVGRRCPPGRLRPRLTLPADRGHHRPGRPAGEGHLVPGHQPAAPRRSSRRHRPSSARRPRRNRPSLRITAVDRAELQADQGRTRLGRLPNPLRPRHPPPPDPGQLRLLLLLETVVRPTRTRGRLRAGPVSRRPAREGAPPRPTSPSCPAGPELCAPSAPGSPRPPPCSAGGEPGLTRTLPPSSRH
ncbi:transposase [Streptomyces sp. NPDC020845]|uniref:IS701 family transposase n=1 Tax=Streptomyces sp. NPDC020845 TaxID=3365096 RepID=UPI0037A107A7